MHIPSLMKIHWDFFFLFFLDFGFTALSRIFHLYRADRSSKVGENWSIRGKTTWPSVSRTWLSHMWPKRDSNHSGEKPNGYWDLLSYCPEMKIRTYRRHSVKNWRNCPSAIPKQISTVKAHALFGENPLIFTKVIIRKWKYGPVAGR